MKTIALPVMAMLAQQALATMGPLSIPVIGPVVTAAFGLNPGYIGAFVALTYTAGMVSSVGSGGAIGRYGALRLSQVCLLLCGAGLAVAASGALPLFVAAALLLGTGAGPSTPASSHILARFAPPRIAPLVFSIKQTGVPLGGIMAGTLVPLWLGLYGWRGALLATATLYLGLALAIQPLRGRIDDDRDPRRDISLRSSARTFRHVIADARLRELAIALGLFTGLQLTFGSFFVAFLVDGLGYELAVAGFVFAVGQGAGFAGRILWGWVASRLLPSRLVLGLLGIGMALAGGAFALLDATWPYWAVVGLSVAFGVTGIGFQGVHLAEVARNAPPGAAGAVTGAVVVFAYAGMTAFPATVGAIVGASGSYRVAFLIAAAATVPISISFFRKAG